MKTVLIVDVDLGAVEDLQGMDFVAEQNIDFNEISIRDSYSLKEIQRKQNHNEAEKKRVRNINKCVDDLKVILDVGIIPVRYLQNASIPHKSDKVSTLEATVSYMRELIKERDRLNTNLGCMLQ